MLGVLQVIGDVIEFGPIGALEINTSVIPAAERSAKKYKRSNNDSYIDKEELLNSISRESRLCKIILGKVKPLSNKEQQEADKYKEFIVKEIAYGDEGKLVEIANYIIDTENNYKGNNPNGQQVDSKIMMIDDKAGIPAKIEAEIVINSCSIDQIISNISTAIHEFTVEEEIDRQLIMCFIAAYYKYNNRIDKEVLDQILVTDEDRTMYISILRWFDSVKAGYPYKAGRILLQDSVVKELKDLLNWQISYDNEHVSAAKALNIKKGFEDILENLKGLKQDIIVEPITVTVGKQIPKSGYTDEEKKIILQRLETDFAEILKDHKESGLLTYKFNILSDIAELIVIDKDLSGAPARYRIDPGIIIGNGTNLIYYVTEQDGVARDIYVNVNKRPEIVKNIIDNPGYNMTPDDIQKSFADYFTVKQIYYYIDMSSFSTHISTFKQQKMDQLENKLTAVFNILNTQNGIPEGRFRLKEWKGIDNFTLISDKDCRSPFASNGSTCGDIVSGMIISIIKDNITVTYKDPANLGKVNEAKFAIMH